MSDDFYHVQGGSDHHGLFILNGRQFYFHGLLQIAFFLQDIYLKKSSDLVSDRFH